MYAQTSMEEIDLSEPSPCQGDGEKRKAGLERCPLVLVFTSTKALWATFALIYVVGFVICFMESILGSLQPCVMSDFSGESIQSVLTMVVRIVSGVSLLPTAKFIDEFGRYRGFVLAGGLTVLGLAIQTMATSLTTTVVAQVLHGVAQNCLGYVLLIILADMTSLKNRALIYGIYVTPMLVTSFAAPNIAAQLYSRFGWRWIFGVSANVLFVICAPLALVLLRAQPTRSEVDETSGLTTTAKQPGRLARMRRFAVELDLPGIFLALSGLCLVLLPLTHPPGSQDGWPTSTLIAMLVLGTFSMVGFTIWEGDLSPSTCVLRLLRDRNVLGGCLVAVFSALSAACWGSTYHSYLVVANDQTSATAGHITDVQPFTFALSAPFLGFLICISGNYHHLAFIAGPFLGAFTGLLLVFNGPDALASGLAVCQIFIGLAMRLFIACSQMAVMANIDHKDVALAMGIWGTFLWIAVAIGSGYSEMTWSRAIPHVLEHALPFDSRNLTKEIADSLVTGVPMQYPMGSLVRGAVMAAYRVAQKHVLIVAICFVPVAIACLLMWEDIDVRKRDDRENVQAKGVIW